MVYALQLEANPWDQYLSPAYVFPMPKQAAIDQKAAHDAGCEQLFLNDIIKAQAKNIMSVVCIGGLSNGRT